MRVCNARGLLAPTQAIEAELDLHDQRLVDDALAAGNLVAWKSVREFQKRA